MSAKGKKADSAPPAVGGGCRDIGARLDRRICEHVLDLLGPLWIVGEVAAHPCDGFYSCASVGHKDLAEFTSL